MLSLLHRPSLPAQAQSDIANTLTDPLSAGCKAWCSRDKLSNLSMFQIKPYVTVKTSGVFDVEGFLCFVPYRRCLCRTILTVVL